MIIKPLVDLEAMKCQPSEDKYAHVWAFLSDDP